MIQSTLLRRDTGTAISHESFKMGVIKQNIKTKNFKRSILKGHLSQIVTMDVQGLLAATLDVKCRLILWNLPLKRNVWSYETNPENGLAEIEKVKIIGNSVLCAIKKDQDLIITMIDTKSGLVSGYIHCVKPLLAKTCLIDDKIFILTSPATIHQWNLNGIIEAVWNTNVNPNNSSEFFGWNSSIVVTDSDTMVITNRLDNTFKRLDLSTPLPADPNEKKGLQCVHLQNSLFACKIAYKPKNRASELCYTVDIERGAVVNQNPYSSSGEINRVANTEDSTFVADSKSTIIAYNLRSRKIIKKIFKPDSFSTGIAHSLALEGELLVSAHDVFGDTNNNIKFWDTAAMRQIGETQVKDCHAIAQSNGVTICQTGNDLVLLDLLEKQNILT